MIKESKVKNRADAFKYLLIQRAKDLEIDQGINLEETLSELAEIEPVLYWKVKRYRDHLIHSCRVALLGFWMLERDFTIPRNDESRTQVTTEVKGHEQKKNIETLTLRDYFYNMLPSEIVYHITGKEKVPFLKRYRGCELIEERLYDKSHSYIIEMPTVTNQQGLVEKIWLLTALYHDVGYSFTYFRKLFDNNKLLEQNHSPTLDSLRKEFVQFFDRVSETIRTHSTSLSSSIYNSLMKEIPHGAIGAFHVRDLPEDEYILETAARAIAKHDDETREIFFEEEPFAYLLVLMDEIQEWGRPVHTSHETNLTDIRTLSQKLLAEDELLSIGWEQDKDNSTLIFTFDYTPTQDTLFYRTNFSFPHFFYAKQLNLSRLRGPLPIELRFKLDTPPSKERFCLPTRQFEWLQAAAHERKNFLLEKWCQEFLDDPHIERSNGEKWKIFKLGFDQQTKKINSIPRPPKIKNCIDDYMEKLFKWIDGERKEFSTVGEIYDKAPKNIDEVLAGGRKPDTF